MTFPVNVERWRNTVNDVISAYLKKYPSKKLTISRSGMIISGDGISNYPPALDDVILAIIQKESSGNFEAVGDGGKSVGLMQLNYGAGTPQFLGFRGDKTLLFDGYTNIWYGLKYLIYQLERNKFDLSKAILAYNAGSYRTKDGVPINQNYLEKVLTFLGTSYGDFAAWFEKKKLPSQLPQSV